uniref:Release factor glutamine methyltransferase n=1 Tax=Anthurium amnicola TaxID=1678845 RepID=A0A1D1Z6W1_9ARAE
MVMLAAKGLLRGANHVPIQQARSPPSAMVADPATTATRCRRSGVMKVPRAEISEPDKKKVANISAKHRERITLPGYADGDGRSFPISEFLTHPSGVESILNTRALQRFEPLEPNTYRVQLKPVLT